MVRLVQGWLLLWLFFLSAVLIWWFAQFPQLTSAVHGLAAIAAVTWCVGVAADDYICEKLEISPEVHKAVMVVLAVLFGISWEVVRWLVSGSMS